MTGSSLCSIWKQQHPWHKSASQQTQSWAGASPNWSDCTDYSMSLTQDIVIGLSLIIQTSLACWLSSVKWENQWSEQCQEAIASVKQLPVGHPASLAGLFIHSVDKMMCWAEDWKLFCLRCWRMRTVWCSIWCRFSMLESQHSIIKNECLAISVWLPVLLGHLSIHGSDHSSLQ